MRKSTVNTFQCYLSLAFLMASLSTLSSQERYKDKIFRDITKTTYTYSDTLQLDYYFSPKDNLDKKPLVLLMHGGGFAQGKRNGAQEQKFSIALAQKGYGVVSISYRLTRNTKSFGCDVPVQDKIKTYRSALTDLQKALKFLNFKSADLKLNLQQTILAGSSAGASTILNALFLKSHYALKGIPFDDVKFIGGISLSGALLDVDYFRTSSPLSLVMLHGEVDRTLPFSKGPHRSCGPSNEGYLLLDGPMEITKKMKESGNSYLCVSDPEGNHDWADFGYQYTDIITDFLYRTLVLKEQLQSFQNIKHLSTPEPMKK